MAASHLRSTSTQLRAPVFWTLVGGVSLIGSALLVPSIGANIALVDMALVLVIGYWIHTLGRSEESPERGLLRSAAPWFLLIAFATVVALFGVGFPSWALLHIAESSLRCSRSSSLRTGCSGSVEPICGSSARS